MANAAGLKRPPNSSASSVHKIREFELEKVSLADEFDIVQIVGEGWYGKILLAEHRASDTEMALKVLPKAYTPLKDFFREFHYGLHLSAHRNIISTYDVAFETAGFYVFSQEYAPLGDLTSNVTDNGIGELHTRRVARQLAAALTHMHNRSLVHRDVKLDNVLIFKSDFSRIKLCDFGETCRSGSLVRRHNEWLPYAPPEVLLTATDEMYKAEIEHDVWQFAIVIFVCLTGCLPWQKACLDDPRYYRYFAWQTSTLPFNRLPKLFRKLTSRAQRLFRKILDPKPDRRSIKLNDIHKFLDDRWIAKGVSEKSKEISAEEEGLCPSMYSFHSSPEEKNKLLSVLNQHGIETTVDRTAKKARIREWIQNSVIHEADEEEANPGGEEVDEDEIALKDNMSIPLGESIIDRGPIQQKQQHQQHQQHQQQASSPAYSMKLYRTPVDPRLPFAPQKEKFLRQDMAKKNKGETSDYESESSSKSEAWRHRKVTFQDDVAP